MNPPIEFEKTVNLDLLAACSQVRLRRRSLPGSLGNQLQYVHSRLQHQDSQRSHQDSSTVQPRRAGRCLVMK
jgi:hypothetical protein